MDKVNASEEWILLDDRRTIAQMKRMLGRTDEAFLEMQQLEKENPEKLGKPDGFVFEELAELYLSKGQEVEAKSYFAMAYPLVKDDLADSKYRDRLMRMKKLTGL